MHIFFSFFEYSDKKMELFSPPSKPISSVHYFYCFFILGLKRWFMQSMVMIQRKNFALLLWNITEYSIEIFLIYCKKTRRLPCPQLFFVLIFNQFWISYYIWYFTIYHLIDQYRFIFFFFCRNHILSTITNVLRTCFDLTI